MMGWIICTPPNHLERRRTQNRRSKSMGKLNDHLFSVNSPTVLTRRRRQEYQLYIEIATDVLKTQNQTQLKALKNFLTALPSPTDIEAVLAETINQLAEVDLEACRWILRHPDYLMPELDVISLALEFALSKLKNQGFVLEEDFYLETSSQLGVSEEAKMALFSNCSVSERLLLEEILKLH